MTKMSTSNSIFTIPTIDLSSPSRQEIIAQIHSACTTSGFFQLINHGVPLDLQEAVFAGAKAFFDLEVGEKEGLDMRRGGGRGYERFAAQSLSASQATPDQKEGFYIGRSLPSSHPLVERGTFLLGPNQWPLSSSLRDDVFKDVMERYYDEMMSLAGRVLGLIGEGLVALDLGDGEKEGGEGFEGIYYKGKDETDSKDDEEGNEEDNWKGEDTIATLRLLHYPPSTTPPSPSQPPPKPKQTLGAGPHTDFGFITLLLQDGVGGLEVLDPSSTSSSTSTSTASSEPETQKWQPVPPTPNAYIVNIGDMLQMFTKGKFKSSVHRVVLHDDAPDPSSQQQSVQANQENEGDGGRRRSRYSIPFFFDGRAGFVLKRKGDSGGNGNGKVREEDLTVEGYMRERFAGTYSN